MTNTLHHAFLMILVAAGSYNILFVRRDLAFLCFVGAVVASYIIGSRSAVPIINNYYPSHEYLTEDDPADWWKGDQ